MNILSLILGIAAIVIFILASRGHKHATIAIGLALVTAAWMAQLLFVTDQITI